MSRSFWFGSFSILLLASLLFLFVSCFEQPVSPYQPPNTKIYLTIKSPTLTTKLGQYIDSVGDSINIGVTSNLPQFVDSVSVGIFSDAYVAEQGKVLKNINALDKDPTWYDTLLTQVGKKYIIAHAFIEDHLSYSDTTIIIVVPKSIPAVPRSKPNISVTGQTTIAAGQLCSLSVTVNDSTVGQTHTFFAKQDTQSQLSVFTPPFMWTPPAGFSGTSTVFFKVADTDSPSYYDTAMVVITVLAPTSGPHWAKDTVSLTGAAGTALNLTLTDKCTGDSLTFSLADAPALAGDTIINSVYSYTFAANDTTTYWPKIIATDKKGKADTMTLHLWATPNPASAPKALTAFSFTSPSVIGTINESAKTVALTVPYGTDVTALVATFITTGASVKVGSTAQTSGTTANNFTSPITYIVVAIDGSTQAYTVTVTIAANSGKALTAFSFTTPAVMGTINESAKTVALTVPFGTDVTALVATFAVSSGASVKVGSTSQTSGTTANNFTSPVTYTVVAGDGSTQAYVVTVTIASNTAKALTAFSFTTPAVTGTINESAKTVALTVPYGTDVTALVATFASTGASVKVGTTAQISGTTANNFSSPVTYIVVAAEGSMQAYVVTVTVAANTAKAMTAFSFTSPAATGTITGTNIAVTVPFGTDVTALVATFASTGASVKVGSTAQISGTTANNFSSPITYMVVANDGSMQAYVVTVTIAANTAKAMTAFSFTSPAATGTITGTNIAVTVPFGTDVTALVATFTSTGASVKVGSAAQTSGTTANSFSSPVTYTVVASDGSTQAFVVTVTVAANSGKSITAFSFASLSVTGTINESAKTISVAVPYNTDVTGLVATFSVSAGASVKVGSAVQTSGTTQNNFSNAVTYTVTAADGSSQAYAVTVTITPNSAKAVTSFSFAGLSPVATGTITGTNIAVTGPFGTDVTTLVATFVTTGASVKIGTVVQVSGTTINDFSKPVFYTVFAADGSAQSYTVTVTVAANTAIIISTQPKDSTTCLGLPVSFSVSATGPGTLLYQWKLGTTSLTSASATTKTLTIASIAATDAGSYTCVVTNAAGASTTSAAAKLTVNVPSTAATSATAQAASICPGSIDTLTVNGGVLGTGATWTWYAGGCGTGTAVGTGTKIGVSPSATTTYYVRAEGGSCGNATTCVSVQVIVNSGSTAPTSATAQTASICPGSFDTLTVNGGSLGTGGAAWTWYAGGCGTGTAIGTGTKIGVSPSATTTYYVRAEGGSCGNATTCVSVQVTVNVAPGITTQPTSIAVNKGASAAFNAAINANVSPTPTYTWQKEGSTTTISSTPTLTLPNVVYTDSGRFRVSVTNICGSVQSAWAHLTVNDVTKPTLTLNGASLDTILVGSSWTDPGATATDDYPVAGTNISSRITTASTPTLSLTQIGTYIITYSVTDLAGNAATQVTRTVKVVGWERVQTTSDPSGSSPSAVMTSNGDIYMAYVGSAGVEIDKLPSGTKTWAVTTSSIDGQTSFLGGFDMALSNDKTTPYIGYVNSAGHDGSVSKYAGGAWQDQNANMQCNTATWREPSYQGFALNTQNNAVLCSDDGTEYFIGLCDGTGSNSGTYGGGPFNAFSLQYNSANDLFWANGGIVNKWDKVNFYFNPYLGTSTVPGYGTDQTCANIVLRFDNSNKCYVFRTSGSVPVSNYPEVWKENGSSWVALGGGPLKNGAAPFIHLNYGDDLKMYASYYDPDSAAIMVKQYNSSNDTWLPFPPITNGKLPVPQCVSGYAIMIQSGAVYIVSSYASGIATWCYKP